MQYLTALELAEKIKTRKIGVCEAVSRTIAEIEKNDSRFNAFITISKEYAMQRAKEIQAKIDGGEILSSLAGVPIAIKDNISTAGIKTTCASKILENYTPVFNADCIEKIENAGMIIVGKLNMDEFAMGGSSETGAFGAVRNPWDTKRVAGGSSGGSAAAVAGGLVSLTLGSDTGGSIRQPCAFCGTTGIKPTYGAVSRFGLIAYASSLDQIGTIGNNIDDCAALLSIISGADERDSTCVIKNKFCFDKTQQINGLKIGIPRNYLDKGIDPDVKTAVISAAKEFENAGAIVKTFEMPLTEFMVPAYYICACAEASSNLSRFDGLKYGVQSENAKSLNEVYRLSRSENFGLEVKRRIMLGSFVLSSGFYDAYYKKALLTRTLVKNAYKKIFEKHDFILSPVAPTSAFKIGENICDPMKMYMGDIYTISVNLAGLPAVSLPCGFDKNGLPVGFQIIGNAFSEEKLVNAARIYQKCTEFHKRRAGEK